MKLFSAFGIMLLCEFCLESLRVKCRNFNDPELAVFPDFSFGKSEQCCCSRVISRIAVVADYRRLTLPTFDRLNHRKKSKISYRIDAFIPNAENNFTFQRRESSLKSSTVRLRKLIRINPIRINLRSAISVALTRSNVKLFSAFGIT